VKSIYIYCQIFYQLDLNWNGINSKLGDIQCLINHVFWIITTLEHTTMDQSVNY